MKLRKGRRRPSRAAVQQWHWVNVAQSRRSPTSDKPRDASMSWMPSLVRRPNLAGAGAGAPEPPPLTEDLRRRAFREWLIGEFEARAFDDQERGFAAFRAEFLVTLLSDWGMRGLEPGP